MAPNATFEEVLYLLWNDQLPNSREFEALKHEMASFRPLPSATVAILNAAAERKLSPMDGLRIGIDTLSLADPDPLDNSRKSNEHRAVLILSAAPTIVATYWRFLNGQEPIQPDPSISHAVNYLYMLTGEKPHKSFTLSILQRFCTLKWVTLL